MANQFDPMEKLVAATPAATPILRFQPSSSRQSPAEPPFITRRSDEGEFPPPVNAQVTQESAAAALTNPTTPFALIIGADNSTPPVPTVNFVPGKIGLMIPTFNGSPMTTATPMTVPGDGVYSAWLQVDISMTQDSYHPTIPTSSIVVELSSAHSSRVDFKVEWADPLNKILGSFYILIADFTVASNVVTVSHQWLSTNYRGLVLVSGNPDDYFYAVG